MHKIVDARGLEQLWCSTPALPSKCPCTSCVAEVATGINKSASPELRPAERRGARDQTVQKVLVEHHLTATDFNDARMSYPGERVLADCLVFKERNDRIPTFVISSYALILLSINISSRV